MGAQHTFKSTKRSAWIDGVLTNPLNNKGNKGDFIRELVIEGLIRRGLAPKGTQLVVNYESSSDIPQTFSTQMSDNFMSGPAITPPVLDIDEPTIETKILSVDDLDSKLDSMDFG